MTSVELQTELLDGHRLTVVSKFRPSVEFPLTNLDWNATSRPLKTVETLVEEMSWRRYGNPHSCGTLTGQTSGDLIDECSTSVLGNIGLDDGHCRVYYGGEGSTFWLQTLARNFSGRACVTVQEELHTSLINPFLEQGCRVYRSKTLSWVRKFNTLGDCKGQPILLITLMSHLTGDEFYPEDLPPIKSAFPEMIVVVDATSYLAHRKRIPEGLVFDYLVFSGHKFPGGPGSTGCLISKVVRGERFHDMMGTPNVLGICRLAMATRIRTRLMNQESKNADKLIKDLGDYLSGVRENNTRFVLHGWNVKPINRRAPVFCFSVELTDRDLIIHPQVVALILLNAYGIQIRAGGHCSDTVLSRTGIWGELEDVDLSKGPVLEPSVCRISFPRFLLTESWVSNIKDKLTDFIRCARLYLPCFTPALDGWSFNEQFIAMSRRPTILAEETGRKRDGCSGCSKNRSLYRKTPQGLNEEGVNFGIVLYASISGTIIAHLDTSPRPGSDYERLLSYPFRWFALPGDSKILDDGV